MNTYELYELTHPQKRIWYEENIHQETSMSNIGGTIRINGHLNINALHEAIHSAIRNNHGMRIRLKQVYGIVKQFVENYDEKESIFNSSGCSGRSGPPVSWIQVE